MNARGGEGGALPSGLEAEAVGDLDRWGKVPTFVIAMMHVADW